MAAFSKPELRDGQVVVGENLSQLMPGTPIGQGVKGLTFIGCNLTNCIVPDDAKVERCNTTQVSFCSHLHPELVALGLPECGEDCEHVTGVVEVTLPGGEVLTSYEYEDRREGRK